MISTNYVGSAMWRADAKEALSSLEVTHQSGEVGGVRLIETQADTGSRYVVAVTPLGAAGTSVLGGPMLVTVCSPWEDSWAMKATGPLAASYVWEHLTAERWSNHHINGGDLAVLTQTVAYALGRQPVFDVFQEREADADRE